MTTPDQRVADALRNVTAKIQNAIDRGERSRGIDADDLVEVLLCVADELDSRTRGMRDVTLEDYCRELLTIAGRDGCIDCGEPDSLTSELCGMANRLSEIASELNRGNS